MLFAQTYKPSRAAELVATWKQSLEKDSKGKVAKIIGVPGTDDDLFPEWDEYLRLEKEGGSAATPLVDVSDEVEDDAGEAEEVVVEGEEEAETEA